MKSPITWLPSLMVFGFAAALAAQTPVATTTDSSVDRDAEIHQLRQELKIISDRLEQLEAEGHPSVVRAAALVLSHRRTGELPPVTSTASKSSEVAATVPTLTPEDAPTLSFFRGTTINLRRIDGYYGYNFNAPIGRVNLLRAYDVTSNSFNLNQVNVVIRAPS